MNLIFCKKFVSVILLTAGFLGGCGSSDVPAAENTEKTDETVPAVQKESTEEPSETSTEPEIHLHIDGRTNYMELMIEQFKEEHPEVTVHTTDYSDLWPADYHAKLASQMMTGEGPDVLMIINTGNDTFDTFPSLIKMIQSDVFMDINDLEIDLSGCNEKVMKAGIYEDKQVLLPLNYSLGFLYTTKERLAEAGISYYDGITLEEFSAGFPAFYENNPEKKAFLNYLTGQDLFPLSSISFVDYTAGELIDSAENIEKMERLTRSFDNLFPRIFESGDRALSYMFYRNLKNYGSVDRDIYQSGDLLFMSGRGFTGAYDCILMYNNYIYPEDIAKGETPVLFPMPTVTGEMPSPNVTYYLAVNAKTKNTDAVRKFLETAIGEDLQYHSVGAGIPVNNAIMEHMEESYLTPGYDPSDPHLFPQTCEYDREFVESYFYYIDNMKDALPYMDRTTVGYLFTIIRNNLRGEATVEEGFADAESQVKFYLSE